MAQPKYRTVSGIVFAIVSILHLLRIIFDMDMIFGSWSAPWWLSAITCLVTGALSLWAFKAKSN